MSLADPMVDFLTAITVERIKTKVNYALRDGGSLVGPIMIVLPADKKDTILYTATIVRDM